MTENQLYQGIVALLEERPVLLWHHCRDSRACDGPRGFPDLVVIGPKGIIFAEIKSADGDTSAEQDLFGYTIEAIDRLCGRECERFSTMWQVWQPGHLDGGAIADQLNLIEGP